MFYGNRMDRYFPFNRLTLSWIGFHKDVTSNLEKTAAANRSVICTVQSIRV